MTTAEKALRKAKLLQTICCDKCGAVGVLVDGRTEARTWIVGWRCACCGAPWFARDPAAAAYPGS